MSSPRPKSCSNPNSTLALNPPLPPQDIEEIVSKHPAIAEVAVFGVPDPKWGELVIAMVVPKPGIAPDEIDQQELMKWTNARVGAKYQRLHGVLALAAEQVPRNIAGKVLKRTLRDDFRSKFTPKARL